MIIDLKKMFSAGKMKIECDLKLDLPAGDLRLLGDKVHVSGELKNMAGNAELSIMLSYSLAAVCDRCSADVLMNEELAQQHILARTLQGDEDVDLYIQLQDGRLDLDQLVYDDILLNLPGKILCEEDCKGLCAVCGINLNQGNCECAAERIDPRLEALKQFLR